MNTVQILNQLLALHSSSLPMYFTSAPPHRLFGDEKAWEAIEHIISDQKLMIDKIADKVETLDGTPNRGEFPMEFTAMHDLGMQYLLQRALERQQNENSTMERLADLTDDESAKALCQEALGAGKAHVESLEECLSPSTT